MDNRENAPARPIGRAGRGGWLPAAAVALLAAQLALLWLQGALLNRQHREMASLKAEIRELAIAVNEAMFMEDDRYATPAAARPAGGRRCRGRARAPIGQRGAQD